MRTWRALLTTAGVSILVGGLAAEAVADAAADNRSRVNQHVVGVVGGAPGSTDLDLAYDLNIAFSDDYDLRIMATTGQGGSGKKFEDLLYLRGIDLAVMQHDVIEFMDNFEIYPGIKTAVRLIASLGSEQMHVLASERIGSIYDLAGRKVNFGLAESGTSMTATVVFDGLGIGVQVTNLAHQVALEALRNGEIDAMIRTSTAPISLFNEVTAEDRLHLLSVPLAGGLEQTYAQVPIDSSVYPYLIAPGETISTVAVATTLISYNWPRGSARGDNLARFTERFYGEYDKLLQDGLHSIWREIDPTDPIPGVAWHWSAEQALPLFRGRSS